MTTVARPIAPCAAIFAVAGEAAARAHLVAFAERFALDIVRLGWEPREKHGAQSRVWFWWRLPCPEEGDALAALDRLAEAVVAPSDRSRLRRVVDRDEDTGAVRSEIVVAATMVAIREPGLLWLDLEVDLSPEVQADLAAALTS